MGLEGLIQYAQQVNYVFSVYYDPFSKQPVVFQESPGLGAIREPWSVGSYSYIMLRAYELTGESKYLTEAQTAMNTLMTTMSYTESNSYYTATYSDPMEMPVMELMGNSYGAVAAAKLHRLTNESKYLTYQRDFLNVLLRMTTWFEDQTDARSRDVRSLGLFYPFVAAPTPTAWETAEANLCLAWVLKNDRTNSRAPLLARLSNFNRINSFYFYPATFTPNIRSINPSLRTDVGQYFPTENMYTLEFPSGSGGSPSQTAIYMTGLGMWNSWLYEALAAATDRSILVLNLASLEDYEQSLRCASREFLVCNPADTTVSTTITNQALEVGTYQVTVTDPSGAVLSTTNQTHSQLLAGFPDDPEFATGHLSEDREYQFSQHRRRYRKLSLRRPEVVARLSIAPGGSPRPGYYDECSSTAGPLWLGLSGLSIQQLCSGLRPGRSNRNQPAQPAGPDLKHRPGAQSPAGSRHSVV